MLGLKNRKLKMQVELSAEELTILLDALAEQPLKKSYNLFKKLLHFVQELNKGTGVAMPETPKSDS